MKGGIQSAQAAPAELRACDPHPFTPDPAVGFARVRSHLIAEAGAPGHSIQDVLAPVGAPVTLEGKFAYGSLSKDLEGEPVRAFLDSCDGWKALGEAKTDGDGRARFPVSAPLGPGLYGVRMEVLGDASLAEASLRVLPRGTHLVVFDMDGTLTTGDEEIVKDVEADLFRPILSGSYTPAAYGGAVELTKAQAARGEVIVYLSGRPYWLSEKSRAWLSSQGFAEGALHLTDSNAEALPYESGVGAYKLSFLKQLIAAGFLIDYAYGNASTDVYAYLGAGLSKDIVYIIGPHGGEIGTHAVLGSWDEEVKRVSALPKVAQP